MDWSTVDPVEVVRLLASLIGTPVALWGLVLARRDLRLLYHVPNRGQRWSPQEFRRLVLVARVAVRWERFGLLAQVILLWGTVRALTLPPNPAATPGGVLISSVLLILLAGGFSWMSLRNVMDRRQFDRLYNPKEHTHGREVLVAEPHDLAQRGLDARLDDHRGGGSDPERGNRRDRHDGPDGGAGVA